MNDYSVSSVLFAPIVIFLAALLVTGIAQILTALRRAPRGSQRPRPPASVRQMGPAFVELHYDVARGSA